MNREKITRTIERTICTVRVFNRTTEAVETASLSLITTVRSLESLKKKIDQELATKDMKLIEILDVEKRQQKFEMSLSEFAEHGHIVSEGGEE